MQACLHCGTRTDLHELGNSARAFCSQHCQGNVLLDAGILDVWTQVPRDVFWEFFVKSEISIGHLTVQLQLAEAEARAKTLRWLLSGDAPIMRIWCLEPTKWFDRLCLHMAQLDYVDLLAETAAVPTSKFFVKWDLVLLQAARFNSVQTMQRFRNQLQHTEGRPFQRYVILLALYLGNKEVYLVAHDLVKDFPNLQIHFVWAAMQSQQLALVNLVLTHVSNPDETKQSIRNIDSAEWKAVMFAHTTNPLFAWTIANNMIPTHRIYPMLLEAIRGGNVAGVEALFKLLPVDLPQWEVDNIIGFATHFDPTPPVVPSVPVFDQILRNGRSNPRIVSQTYGYVFTNVAHYDNTPDIVRTMLLILDGRVSVHSKSAKFVSAVEQDREAVLILLLHGAPQNMKDADERQLQGWAIQNGWPAALKVLLRKDGMDFTLAYQIFQKGQYRSFAALVYLLARDGRADPRVDGFHILELAIEEDYVQGMRIFLQDARVQTELTAAQARTLRDKAKTDEMRKLLDEFIQSKERHEAMSEEGPLKRTKDRLGM